MHKVTHSIRRITSVELPTVRNLDGTTRPANAQELLNFGLVPLGGDTYSCCVQETSDDGRTWTDPQLPGVELSRGRPKDRFGRLPAAVRAEVMIVRVERTTGTGAKRKTETFNVHESEILPGDVEKGRGILPHVWAGERT